MGGWTNRNAGLAVFDSVTMDPFMKAAHLTRSFAHNVFTPSYHEIKFLAKWENSAYPQCHIFGACCKHLCSTASFFIYARHVLHIQKIFDDMLENGGRSSLKSICAP